MLRDNLAGSSSRCAGAYPLALFNHNHQPSDDRPHALKIPAPIGAESTLTENAPSPFHAEPGHNRVLTHWLSGNIALRKKHGTATTWGSGKLA